MYYDNKTKSKTNFTIIHRPLVSRNIMGKLSKFIDSVSIIKAFACVEIF